MANLYRYDVVTRGSTRYQLVELREIRYSLVETNRIPHQRKLEFLMAKKTTKDKAKPNKGERPIAENRKARHNYLVLETLECGIALVGSEVKSLRNGRVSLDEAYGRMKDGEMWLVGADIPEYANATMWNHEPKRPRKLLVHGSELRKFGNKAHEKGLTLVPLKMYFNDRGFAKVLMGLCRGKQLHDKRDSLKKADMKREMDRAMRRR